MNVFEDLIEELKEENLLEETVIETNRRNSERIAPLSSFEPRTPENELTAAGNEVQGNEVGDSISVPEGPATEVPDEFEQNFALPDDGFQELPAVPVFFDDAATAAIPLPAAPEITARPAIDIPLPELKPSQGRTSFAADFDSLAGRQSARPVVNQKEYFKKRAIDEVTGLQMVDHVLSGVEREQMKLVPKSFDDIPVKKALHDFMQVSGNTKSPDHARAEFQLMQETESWYSSLSHRDRHISVAHLRRYCETTKPLLSPQALIAMGRFYRNSPFSEQIRNKFDLILTRLFTSENEDEIRELLFPREELIAQIKDLYADWSSIQLYTAAEDDSELLIAVLKFQDFITEAESTHTFDELIGNDFFNRLRLFKESLNENFFAPLISVASIEANVKIGNRYVELIKRERNGANAVAIEEKYGFLHDQAISDSTGKTYQLVDLLHERTKSGENETLIKEVRVNADEEPVRKRVKKKRDRIFAVNKWLLAATILVTLVCGGIYVWAEYQSRESQGSSNSKVISVNLESSSLKQYLQTAKINEDTFYGVTLETWTDLNLEKKEELLKKIQSIGAEKGFKKVHLVNPKGQAVGFAGDAKVEVYNP